MSSRQDSDSLHALLDAIAAGLDDFSGYPRGVDQMMALWSHRPSMEARDCGDAASAAQETWRVETFQGPRRGPQSR